MLLRPSFVAALLVSICEVVFAAVGNVERQTTDTSFMLYAYGENINGLPVFYGDAIAYIGKSAPLNVTENVNITFTPASTDATTWSVSPNTTTVATNWTTSPVIYINPSSGAFDSVGFVNTTDTALPDGAVTSGFVFYGQSVMYQDSKGMLEAKFWATETNKTNVWILKWNSDGVSQDGSVPVVIKSTPPVTISSV